jgi:hypothetical protein
MSKNVVQPEATDDNMALHEATRAQAHSLTREPTPTHIHTSTHAPPPPQRNMQYSLLFHGNNGYVNAPQCYVIRTLPVLLLRTGFTTHLASAWVLAVNRNKVCRGGRLALSTFRRMIIKHPSPSDPYPLTCLAYTTLRRAFTSLVLPVTGVGEPPCRYEVPC